MSNVKSEKDHLERARNHFQERNMQCALLEIDQAIEINPSNFDSFVLRAWLLCTQQRLSEALDDLRQAIKLKPGSPSLYNARGKLLLDLNYPIIAKLDLDAAVGLDPTDEAALTNRGIANMMLNNFQEALADFNELIRRDRYNAYALYNRAAIREQMEEGVAFVDDYEKALAVLTDVSLSPARRNRARVYSRMIRKFGFIAPTVHH